MHSNNCTKIYPWWARPLPVHGIDAVGHTSGCAVHTVYRVPSVTDRVNGGRFALAKIELLDSANFRPRSEFSPSGA